MGFGFVFLILTKWKCEDGLEQKTLQEHVLRGWKKSDESTERPWSEPMAEQRESPGYREKQQMFPVSLVLVSQHS